MPTKRRYTEEEYVKICYELWVWISEEAVFSVGDEASSIKARWPGWLKYGKMDMDCPCCEFVYPDENMMIREETCVHCPLIGYAWNKMCEEGGEPSTPWEIFRNVGQTTPKRREAAAKIANACRRWLKDHTDAVALPPEVTIDGIVYVPNDEVDIDIEGIGTDYKKLKEAREALKDLSDTDIIALAQIVHGRIYGRMRGTEKRHYE